MYTSWSNGGIGAFLAAHPSNTWTESVSPRVAKESQNGPTKGTLRVYSSGFSVLSCSDSPPPMDWCLTKSILLYLLAKQAFQGEQNVENMLPS